MSGLFGAGAATTAASANTTQGDLKSDVELTQPPEDSVSDLAFSFASRINTGKCAPRTGRRVVLR